MNVRFRPAILSILTAASCLASAVRSQPAPGQPGSALSALAPASAGGTEHAALFVNDKGFLVTAFVANAPAEWTVRVGSQSYPARVVKAFPEYGLMFLQVKADSMDPFPFAYLARGRRDAATPLALFTLEQGGSAGKHPVAVQGVERQLPAMSRGEFYDLLIPGSVPASDGVLVDEKTGEACGLLVRAGMAPGHYYAATSWSIVDRAGQAGIPTPPRPKTPQFEFPDGSKRDAVIRRTPLVNPIVVADAIAAKKTAEWSHCTGFLANTFTGPQVAEPFCYLGSRYGLLFALNLDSLQIRWPPVPTPHPVLAPPSLQADNLCVASSGLNLTNKERMEDRGTVACVDARTGLPRWHYESRFVARSLIVGDRVLFAGLDALGVLDLANGKPVWAHEETGRDHATYHVLAGADADRMWVLSVGVDLKGKHTPADPLRLERSGDTAVLECLSIADDKKRLWERRLKAPQHPPALGIGAILSKDGKICYAATSASMAAVETETGKVIWEMPVFQKAFGGSLEWADAMLLATGSDDQLYAIDPRNGQVPWTFNAAAQPLAEPLAEGGIVYVGGKDSRIWALEAATGKWLWKLELRGRVCGQPCLRGNHLYCITDDGKLSDVELPH